MILVQKTANLEIVNIRLCDIHVVRNISLHSGQAYTCGISPEGTLISFQDIATFKGMSGNGNGKVKSVAGKDA